MTRLFKQELILLTALFLMVAPMVTPAQGAGWFNVPMSPCQCLGYGYGPGYHAPMVLSSPLASGSETKRLIRRQTAPISPVCEFGAPSAIPMQECPSCTEPGPTLTPGVPTLAPGAYVESYSKKTPEQQPPAKRPAMAYRGWIIQ